MAKRRKNIHVITVQNVNSKQNAHHSTKEFFMNTMIKISKQYGNYIIQRKGRRYIPKEGIMLKQVSQFYWNLEISEE